MDWWIALSVSVISLLITLISGAVCLPLLKRFARERIVSDSKTLDELHAEKQNTPTMGGLFLAIAITCFFVTANLLNWQAGLSTRRTVLILVTLWAFTLLGMIDDLQKIYRSTKGLTPRQKWYAQWGLALLISGLSLWLRPQEVPLTEVSDLQAIWLIIQFSWFSFVIVATVNAVNLTDGLDGLASGTIAITCLGLLAGLSLSNPEVCWGCFPSALSPTESITIYTALVGCSVGFLFFNRFPAKVFMGDTGAMGLGSVIGLVSVFHGHEFLLALTGGVFVIETLSVILQIRCNRWLGKKPLRCAPLHNHFVFAGMKETRIVMRFWGAALLFVGLGLAAVWFRNQLHERKPISPSPTAALSQPFQSPVEASPHEDAA